MKNLGTMKDIIADLPKGPLDPYRKCATFDWKLLKLSLEGEDFVKFQVFRKRFYSSNIFNTFPYLKFLFVIPENFVGFYEKVASISKTYLCYFR